MEKSIFYDLYFGNLRPWELGRPKHPNYTQYTRRYGEIAAYLKTVLSPTDYEKFEKLENLQAQYGTFEEVDIFEYGFSMGALLMLEILNFKERRMSEIDENLK